MIAQIISVIAFALLAIAIIVQSLKIKELEHNILTLQLLVGLGIDIKGKKPEEVVAEVAKGLEEWK